MTDTVKTLQKIARGEAVDTSTRTVPFLIQTGYVKVDQGVITLTPIGWTVIYKNY